MSDTIPPPAPEPGSPEARYIEQCAAWEAELRRRNTRPWWKKASDAVADWSGFHALSIDLGVGVFALAFFIGLVALLIGFLTHR